MQRIRRRQRQVDVGRAAHLSPSTIGRQESGDIGAFETLERHARALGLRVEVRLTGRGGELARLADEEHAAIVEALARRLRNGGFEVATEVSFNEWGDRGRVDLAGFDPRRRLLVLVEAKTELADLQDTIGRLDVKSRLARRIAERRGWQADGTVVVLAVAATAWNRALVAARRSYFAGFAGMWLLGGGLPLPAEGGQILLWVPARRAGRRGWLAGRRRIRRAGGRGMARRAGGRKYLPPGEAYDRTDAGGQAQLPPGRS
jgi:hypothetical protein